MKKAVWSSIILLIAFLYSWVGYELTHTKLPTADTPAQLYSTETHHDLQLTFVQAIDEAKQSIRLIIYSLRDKKVINALKRAAARGVDIQIVCDKNASSGVAKKLGSNIQTTYRKGKGLMHLKILVIDQKQVFLGSANLTMASLKMHGNLVYGLESEGLAAYLDDKFDNLKNEGLIEPLRYAVLPFKDQRMEIWLFPDNQDGVERIKKLLRSAQKSVKIAMFTWTHYDLADAVISAHQKGLDVQVVLDRNASQGVSQKIADKLSAAGIDVRVNQGDELLHHKLLIIDDETLLNGSANWTKAAFTVNDDCFLILSPLNSSQRQTLHKMWEEIKFNSNIY